MENDSKVVKKEEDHIGMELTKNEELDLVITLAGHPTNFYFRPIKYDEERLQLEAEMAEFYSGKESEALKVAGPQITPNDLFAFTQGGFWYRVVVMNSVMGSRVPVRFCDYGDITLAEISSLRHLMPKFKESPFMSVKGQLAGVEPIDDTWSPTDCERFFALAEQRLLHGCVLGFVGNTVNPIERIVILSLVNDEGIDIADQLVIESLAIRNG